MLTSSLLLQLPALQNKAMLSSHPQAMDSYNARPMLKIQLNVVLHFLLKPEEMSERNKDKPDPQQLANSKYISIARKPTKPATGQCQRASGQPAKEQALG